MADDIVLKIDINRLRVREVEAIEETMAELGMEGGLEELFPDGKPSAKTLRIIAYALSRHDHPELTFEDAGDVILDMSGVSVPLETPS